jgi:iron complex transport system ATP-binding protein
MLQVSGLVAGYEGREIVHDVTFDVGDGEFVCILGANGCGKTTTLKALLGLIRPSAGKVDMNGQATIDLREAERAKLFAYIPQTHTPPFPFTVRDVVALGRTVHLDRFSRASREDERVVNACMERMGVDRFASTPYTQLSGGQQQLVLIARALAQEPRVLVMDEPTASLDFGNQQLVLRQMRHLAHEGMSVLMVTHDPDHALYCADRVIVMEAGCVLVEGRPADVMDTDCLKHIYQANLEVLDVDVAGRTQRICVPVFD